MKSIVIDIISERTDILRHFLFVQHSPTPSLKQDET